jgi:hypothetical protein
MRPLKIVLLAQCFQQLVINTQDPLTNKEPMSTSFDFMSELQSFQFHGNRCSSMFLFKTMVNALNLHKYRIFCIYNLLLNQDLGDWVKARSTKWYSQFLMTQYDDRRWIENSQVSWSFVRQLTDSLKHIMGKKTRIIGAQFQ